MNPKPRLSYMNSIPIERLSPHKLSQPSLMGLKLQTKYTFMEQEEKKPEEVRPKIKGKKKKKKGKKKNTKRKTLPPITLNTPSLQDLDMRTKLPPVDIEELKSPIKKRPKERPEEKALEEEFLDFELNDKGEAEDLNELIEEEIKKLDEQKGQIRELENHVMRDINVIFEPEQKKPGKQVNEDDMLFSMFKDFHNAKTKSPNPQVQQINEDYSLVNAAIQLRLKELEKKSNELDGFRSMIRECIEKEAKLDDDDFANEMELKFNTLRAENEFLKAYKTIRDEEKDLKQEVNRLKTSIINDTSIYQESKLHLKKIRNKVEGKEKGQITKDELKKAKNGLKYELVSMVNSMQNSNCLLDFGKT